MNSQQNNDMAQKVNPIQTFGIRINLKMKEITSLMLLIFKFREFMEFFKKSWLMVSKRLVSIIKERMKNMLRCWFME